MVGFVPLRRVLLQRLVEGAAVRTKTCRICEYINIYSALVLSLTFRTELNGEIRLLHDPMLEKRDGNMPVGFHLHTEK